MLTGTDIVWKKWRMEVHRCGEVKIVDPEMRRHECSHPAS